MKLTMDANNFSKNMTAWHYRYNTPEKLKARVEWIRAKIRELGFKGRKYLLYRAEREYIKSLFKQMNYKRRLEKKKEYSKEYYKKNYCPKKQPK